MKRHSTKIFFGAIALALACLSCMSLHAETLKGLEVYDYRDTKRLVILVHRAADLIAQKGEKAFEVFERQSNKWTFASSYLYVYAHDGTNLFHGGYPELTGKNLIDFTDPYGKKALLMVIREAQNPNNPHGWTHYLWSPPGSLDPVWKSSSNRMVCMPDGRKVFVGSGIDRPQPEREFFRIVVDEAADLLSGEGKKAVPVIKSPASGFTILNSRVFILDMQGRCIISPGMDTEFIQCLLQYQDLTGRAPIRELAEKLKESDGAWVLMLNKGRIEKHPVKKTIYARLAIMGDQKVIVGAICELPRPAWMD